MHGGEGRCYYEAQFLQMYNNSVSARWHPQSKNKWEKVYSPVPESKVLLRELKPALKRG